VIYLDPRPRRRYGDVLSDRDCLAQSVDLSELFSARGAGLTIRWVEVMPHQHHVGGRNPAQRVFSIAAMLITLDDLLAEDQQSEGSPTVWRGWGELAVVFRCLCRLLSRHRSQVGSSVRGRSSHFAAVPFELPSPGPAHSMMVASPTTREPSRISMACPGRTSAQYSGCVG
jgi:hypothetical protein